MEHQRPRCPGTATTPCQSRRGTAAERRCHGDNGWTSQDHTPDLMATGRFYRGELVEGIKAISRKKRSANINMARFCGTDRISHGGLPDLFIGPACQTWRRHLRWPSNGPPPRLLRRNPAAAASTDL